MPHGYREVLLPSRHSCDIVRMIWPSQTIVVNVGAHYAGHGAAMTDILRHKAAVIKEILRVLRIVYLASISDKALDPSLSKCNRNRRIAYGMQIVSYITS